MKALLRSLTESKAGFSTLALRLVVGIIFIAHGAQKLFGWFGGHGLESTGRWMGSIGLEPGVLMALISGGAEFFGGLFILLGLFTRLGAFLLIITMTVAIFTVHLHNGLFTSHGGYEFNLALIAACISLMFLGAGRLSFDAHIAHTYSKGLLL